MANTPSYTEFDRVPGRRVRLYYDSDRQRLDPEGDAELAALHDDFSSSPDNVVRYARLANRSYYELILPSSEIDADAQVEVPYRRPRWQVDQERDRAVPFEPDSDALGPPSVLFAQPLIVPIAAGRVVEFDQKTVRGATGLLVFQLTADGT